VAFLIRPCRGDVSVALGPDCRVHYRVARSVDDASAECSCPVTWRGDGDRPFLFFVVLCLFVLVQERARLGPEGDACSDAGEDGEARFDGNERIVGADGRSAAREELGGERDREAVGNRQATAEAEAQRRGARRWRSIAEEHVPAHLTEDLHRARRVRAGYADQHRVELGDAEGDPIPLADREGVGDDAIGLTKRGRRMLERAIERNDIPALAEIEPEELNKETPEEKAGQPVSNLALVDQDRVRERMRVYYEMAGDRTIKAYVNVGGGTVSVGTKVGKRKFLPGVNLRPPKGIEEMPPSVLGAFLETGVPGIHVTRIIDLAEEYGLEIAPRIMPEVGTGDVFQKRQPNRWLAGIVLALILLSLFVVARAPWGTRMLRTTIPPESIMPPPPRAPGGFVPRVGKSDGNGTTTDPPQN